MIRLGARFGLRSKFAPNHTPNTGKFPAFHAKDNTAPISKQSKHDAATWNPVEVKDALKKHSVYSWGASGPLFESTLDVDRCEGVYMIDKAGRKHLDWSAGAVCINLGHTVPQTIKKAVADQMDKAAFVYGDLAATDVRARLCSLLAEVSPADLNGFLFASGGAEANEAAIRAARRFTGRPKIMTRYRSYHGGTTNTLSMTGDPRTQFVDGQAVGIVKMMDPFPFHFQWDEDPDKAIQKCLDALHDQILFEGPNTIAGIVVESFTGANGWLVTPASYLQGVRALCDKYGILMICDEVMTGFGRTGQMFGFQHAPGVVPDMFTFAKGVTSAYLPLSGVGMTDRIFDHFRTNPIGYGSTYFAHPMCCAVGYETVKYIIDQGVVQHVQAMEPIMKEEMEKLVESHVSVKQGRVVGLGAGFDLGSKDGNFMFNMHETSEGLALFKSRLREEGLVTLVRGHHVHCTPPLIISEAEIREGFQKLHRCLDDVDKWVMGEPDAEATA